MPETERASAVAPAPPFAPAGTPTTERSVPFFGHRTWYRISPAPSPASSRS